MLRAQIPRCVLVACSQLTRNAHGGDGNDEAHDDTPVTIDDLKEILRAPEPPPDLPAAPPAEPPPPKPKPPRRLYRPPERRPFEKFESYQERVEAWRAQQAKRAEEEKQTRDLEARRRKEEEHQAAKHAEEVQQEEQLEHAQRVRQQTQRFGRFVVPVTRGPDRKPGEKYDAFRTRWQAHAAEQEAAVKRFWEMRREADKAFEKAQQAMKEDAERRQAERLQAQCHREDAARACIRLAVRARRRRLVVAAARAAAAVAAAGESNMLEKCVVQ